MSIVKNVIGSRRPAPRKPVDGQPHRSFIDIALQQAREFSNDESKQAQIECGRPGATVSASSSKYAF